LLNAEELRQCIERAIAALPLAQRAVLILRDMEGLTLEETCNILNISASNSRVLLHRARAALRAAIENYEKERKENAKLSRGHRKGE
jgi:RNA polymerase sigma-70 factor, ECF subfamily